MCVANFCEVVCRVSFFIRIVVALVLLAGAGPMGPPARPGPAGLVAIPVFPVLDQQDFEVLEASSSLATNLFLIVLIVQVTVC